MYEDSGASAAGSLVGVIIITAISLAVLFVIIRSAVVQGMNAHYKTISHYQATGEWRYVTNGKAAPTPRPSQPGSPQ